LLTLSDSPRGYRRDLARAPDAAPTGKTSERVKERLWFYHSHFCRQWNSPIFNLPFINRVQTVHRHVPQNCAPRRIAFEILNVYADFLRSYAITMSSIETFPSQLSCAKPSFDRINSRDHPPFPTGSFRE
jgi:hypothetical protein